MNKAQIKPFGKTEATWGDAAIRLYPNDAHPEKQLETLKQAIRAELNDRSKPVFHDRTKQDFFLYGLADALAYRAENERESKHLDGHKVQLISAADRIKQAADELVQALSVLTDPDVIDVFEGRLDAHENGLVVTSRKASQDIARQAAEISDLFSKDRGGQKRRLDIMPIKMVAQYWQEVFGEVPSGSPGGAFFKVVALAWQQANFDPPSANTVSNYLKMK